jgi:hypothetical protein
MKAVTRFLVVVGLFVLQTLTAKTLCAQTASQTSERHEISPPFGFSWGESPERTAKMLEQAKAKIVGDDLVDGRRCLHVKGIAQRLLRDAFFYFEGDALSEIELHYGDDSWDNTKFNEFFDQTRRHIDSRYGAGRLVARTKTTQDGLTYSLTGYQWSQYSGTLQMFLYTAEKGVNVVRVLSLHYRRP